MPNFDKPVNLRPILEELDETDIEKILQEDVGAFSGEDVPKLKKLYEEFGNPDRVRILDVDGNMYDVIPLPNGKVGVERIEAVLVYSGITQYDSWVEAQEAIPAEWVKQKAIFSSRNEKLSDADTKKDKF